MRQQEVNLDIGTTGANSSLGDDSNSQRWVTPICAIHLTLETDRMLFELVQARPGTNGRFGDGDMVYVD